MNWTAERIAQLAKGRLIQGPAFQKVTGVSTDSRTIRPSHIFVALRGRRFNGHHYLAQVIRKGVRVVMVSQPVSRIPNNVCVIKVKDTVQGMGDWAAAHRREFSGTVIAITGTAGKTTTKDLIADVLNRRLKVLKNKASFNNHIGVPLTLLSLRPRYDVAVVECGTNQKGDMARLAKWVKPDIVVYTNIGAGHLEGLKNRRGVFAEKKALIRYLSADGRVVINNDDEWLRKLRANVRPSQQVTYGIQRAARIRASRIRLEGKEWGFAVNGKAGFRVRSSVRENVLNALAAFGCGRLMKIPYNDIKSAVCAHTFSQSRQQVIRVGSSVVIDDSYNANPTSFVSAMNTLHNISSRGKRILVAGDMLELGERAGILHRRTGECCADIDVDEVLGIGPLMKNFVREAARHTSARHFSDRPRMHSQLRKMLRRGDAVLIKGSRGMQMELTRDFVVNRLIALR